MSPRFRKALFVVAGLLVSCCLCLVVVSVFAPIDSEAFAERNTATAVARTATAEYTPPSSTPQPTATITQTPTPGPTSTPSHTPRPTNTLRPSATSTITLTPEPTNTATPSPDPTVVAYLSRIASITDDYQLALTQIATLSQQASEDPTLFLDEDWKFDMIIALAILLVEEDALQEITPPAEYQEMHDVLLEAAAHYSLAATLMEQGINNIDLDAINQAAVEMQLGIEKIQEANELLEGRPDR